MTWQEPTDCCRLYAGSASTGHYRNDAASLSAVLWSSRCGYDRLDRLDHAACDHVVSTDISVNENVTSWLDQQAYGGAAKRRRRISRPQRVAANHRERKRMVYLNDAFELLRLSIPTLPYEKKLSRIQTLRFAIDYIALMTDILTLTEHMSPLGGAVDATPMDVLEVKVIGGRGMADDFHQSTQELYRYLQRHDS